jgi:hypothetical protein
MAMYQVFVEGPVDRSPDGVKRLAEAMHQRSGLPVAELVARLGKGRFRVKANLDPTAANAYARDLERIGARVVLEVMSEAASKGARAATPPAGVRAATPPAGVRAATPPAGVRAGAAAPGELSVENLGSLDASLLELAPDDGRRTAPAAAAAASAFEAPGTFDLPGTFDAAGTLELAGASEPPAPQVRPGSPAKPTAPGPDVFELPAGDALAVELAPDELQHQARKRAATPLPAPAAAAAPAPAPAAPSPAPAVPSPAAPAAMPRGRFAAGVVLAVVLGFVPAHFIAAARERSAFRKIDEHVVQVQAQTDAPLDDAALDAFRAEQEARKQSQRRSIALASLAIWAAVGGGLAYVWFRRVPWDRLARPR